VKILVDMNLSPTWVEYLAKHDIEAVHWSTVGDPKADDPEIMDYARNNAMLVFTHDLPPWISTIKFFAVVRSSL
jgi:predicted nuclease of predicted toxin-antitoxin system